MSAPILQRHILVKYQTKLVCSKSRNIRAPKPETVEQKADQMRKSEWPQSKQPTGVGGEKTQTWKANKHCLKKAKPLASFGGTGFNEPVPIFPAPNLIVEKINSHALLEALSDLNRKSPSEKN